jgi:uncharacterized protein YjeT (DUF2065 family)
MGANLFVAFALMLVIEGVMPFVAPNAWRNMFKKMIQMSDGQIRFVGLASMGGGLLLLLFTN